MLWSPLGERQNSGMDEVMRLQNKQVGAEGLS